MESFFKGSVGFFIFSGDEATNDPAFLDFIRFVVVDKGHFVSVATKVLQDIDYYVQLVRLSDLKLSMGHNFDYDTFYEYVFAICTEIHRCQSSGKPSHRFDVVLKTSGEDSQMQSLIRRIRDIPYFESTAQLSIQEAERTTIRRESAPVPQTKVAAPGTVAESDGSRVLCFVPMRNCETSIERVVENIKLTVLSKIDEILILDNQSSDQSVMRARDALSTVSQVKTTLRANDTNRGLGGSHKIAFNYAFENGYDYLLVVHGDGSGKLQEFVPVLQQKVFMRHEAVLSSRLSSQKTRTGYPLYRLLGNLFLSGIASLLTRRSVSDFTSGPVNLYRVTSVINKFEKPVLTFDNKVEFPQDILLYLIYRRARFQFIDIDYVEAGGKSAYVAFTQFVRGLQRLFVYRRRYRTKLK